LSPATIRSASEQRRRAWLIASIAPLLLAALYLLFLRLPAASALTKGERSLEQLRAKAPVPAALDLQRREQASLNQRLAAARALFAPRAPSEAVAGSPPTRGALERARLRQRVSELFAAHRLVLVSEEGRELELVPELAAIAGAGSAPGQGRGRLPAWQLEFRGRFLDVLGALRALTGSEYGLLPLRLEMMPDTRAGGLTWKLLLA